MPMEIRGEISGRKTAVKGHMDARGRLVVVQEDQRLSLLTRLLRVIACIPGQFTVFLGGRGVSGDGESSNNLLTDGEEDVSGDGESSNNLLTDSKEDVSGDGESSNNLLTDNKEYSDCTTPKEYSDCTTPKEYSDCTTPKGYSDCTTPKEYSDCTTPKEYSDCTTPKEYSDCTTPKEYSDCTTPHPDCDEQEYQVLVALNRSYDTTVTDLTLPKMAQVDRYLRESTDSESSTLPDADTEDSDEEGHFQHGVYILSVKQHTDALRRAGGIVRTRFPPEPSGPLHLGHARALHVNFSVANEYNGECVLRFDDTNPRTADAHHRDSAVEMTEWLGYTPAKITYTSDYFDMLFSYALEMIDRDKAYVCHEDYIWMPLSKKIYWVSSYRNRSRQENHKEFLKMKEGGYAEGDAVLRMRTTSYTIDPVAYRIITRAHYRTGHQWHIYPTYDFSHPIVDSLEGIAVSLCTTEFGSHRALYQWIQKILYLPQVPQRELSRLVVPYTITSKRRLRVLLGYAIDDFDDPRLATLAGLRRRGIPPQAIKKFVCEGLYEYSQLLDITRDILLPLSPHCMVVLNPLVCNVLNYDLLVAKSGLSQLIAEIPENCSTCHQNSREVCITRKMYISKYDFSIHSQSSRHYLSLINPVHLRWTNYVMHVSGVHLKSTGIGEVGSLDVFLEEVPSKAQNMKVLTWVSDPIVIKVNLIDSHFKESHPSPILSTMALAEPSLAFSLNTGAQFTYGQTYQAERFAYLTLDPSSTHEDFIFNVTCLLRLHPELHGYIMEVFH